MFALGTLRASSHENTKGVLTLPWRLEHRALKLPPVVFLNFPESSLLPGKKEGHRQHVCVLDVKPQFTRVATVMLACWSSTVFLGGQ